MFHEGVVQEDSRGEAGGELTFGGASSPASHQPQEGGAVPRLSHRVAGQTRAQPTQEGLRKGGRHHR